MSSDFLGPNVSTLAARWWALVVRGAAAILFGILAIVTPKISLLALVVLFGAYAIADGVFNFVLAARRARVGYSWGWLLFEALISVVAGALAFIMPGLTALVLLVLIAVWALLTGVAEVGTAIRLRRQIESEWLLATSGILSIALGCLLLLNPGAGALTFVWLIGAYALGFGALLVALGLRLRRLGGRRERQMPSGGVKPA